MRFIVLSSALFATCGVQAQTSDPFRSRNLNPPVAIFGLPTWQRIPDARRLAVTTELANHYRLSARSGDTLILDGETLKMTLAYEHPLGELWSAGIEIPWFRQSGGVLDDLIDGWHSAFGLPDGGRNNRPDDELQFQLARPGTATFNLNRSAEDIGDITLSMARSLGAEDRYVLRASIKLATGEESILAGSGARDWSLTLLKSRDGRLGRREAGYFWGAGVLGLGDPRQTVFAAKDTGWLALVGGGLALTQRFGMKAQIELHTALYDTPLEELGQTAVQASMGGWWLFTGGGRVEFAVIEDMHVSTAPDVVLHFGLNWSL
jgi:hypothetical protein